MTGIMASPTLPATRPIRPTSNLSAELDLREKVIRRGQKAFCELAVAFLEVYDGDLWLARHSNFAAWCKACFNISKSHGSRLVSAGRLVLHHRAAGLPLPAHEKQAREMRAAERNPAPRPKSDKRSPQVPLDGKLVVAVVYQVQILREAPGTGMLRPERLSDWETEQEADAELRRLQVTAKGSSNGQGDRPGPGLPEVILEKMRW